MDERMKSEGERLALSDSEGMKDEEKRETQADVGKRTLSRSHGLRITD
jgi:hypothetical protein